MSNPNRARGLLPAERVLRETPYIASATVYPGDLLKVGSDGKVSKMAASDAVGAIGVAAHYAVSGATVLVWDDPQQKFEAQMHTGAAVDQSFVGYNYDILVNSADATYKQSRTEIDGSTKATTPTTLPLRMLAISADVDNAAGDRAKCIVSINCHALRGGTAGV